MSQQLVNGLTLGVVYALIGMGFSMVWATARTMNFAYGVIFTMGAYTLYVVLDVVFGGRALSIGILFVVLAVTAALALIVGYGLDLAIFRPLRQSEFGPFFASLGVAIIIENALVLTFGSRTKSLSYSAAGSVFEVGPLRLTAAQVSVLAASVLIMITLQVAIARTSFGRAMRATAWSQSTARLMGINPDRVIALVFVIAALLALWAGVFVAFYYGAESPYMGTQILIKGLAAAVIGGFGYLPGAIAGGFLLGLVEAMGAQLTTTGNWPDVMAYTVMILVILIRPQGLLSGKGAIT